MTALPVRQFCERRMCGLRLHQMHAPPGGFRQRIQHPGQLPQGALLFHHRDGAGLFFKQETEGMPQARAKQNRERVPALFRRNGPDHSFFPLRAAGAEHGKRATGHMRQNIRRRVAVAMPRGKKRFKTRAVVWGHWGRALSAGRGSTTMSSCSSRKRTFS